MLAAADEGRNGKRLVSYEVAASLIQGFSSPSALQPNSLIWHRPQKETGPLWVERAGSSINSQPTEGALSDYGRKPKPFDGAVVMMGVNTPLNIPDGVVCQLLALYQPVPAKPAT